MLSSAPPISRTLRKPRKVAIIGTREPSREQIENAAAVARLVSAKGDSVATGGAYGIDLVAMDNTEPGCLFVYLPWASYNRSIVPSHARLVIYDPARDVDWRESVLRLHPAPTRLTRGALALHARNYGIVADADLVVAFPSAAGGGTAQGIRIAASLNIPTLRHTTGQPGGQIVSLVEAWLAA